jgi:protein-disulfide isomerase|tara:strand:+ start:2801 stop:3400 length:600 start_codon:yes stop_codon:yes gene_type:complete
MQKIIKKTLNIIFLTFMLSITHALSEENPLKIGSEDAKVTIKVFSSLTCPHCATFHGKIYKNLKKDYIATGKVRFEHHSFPLDLAALNAEKILRCLDDTDKSFQFLGEIYNKQNDWAVGSDIIKINDSIKKIGKNFSLDDAKMDQCLINEKVQDQILNERIDAQKKYKISSTPTIYINEKKYEGIHEYKEFKKKLDKFL